MKQDYFKLLFNINNVLNEFKNTILEKFFKPLIGYGYTSFASNEFFCYTPLYNQYLEPIKNLIEIIDLLGVEGLAIEKKGLSIRIQFLSDPAHAKIREEFESAINYILGAFNKYKVSINETLTKLSDLEKERLNEAVHCFIEGCYFSTVAMAVSAIEFKLLNLMKSANPNKNLDGMTLGALIIEYLNNKEAYKNVIPKKHEPLLNLCNEYRIFSVHPKEEQVSKNIAQSILNLSFEFLLDKKVII